MGNRQINFGKPFIAAYDRSTGAEKYLSFTTVKDDPIRGFWHSDGQIFLLFKNRVAFYSEKDGRLLMERDFKPESYDDLKFFVRNQFYLSNGNTYYYSLPQYDSTMLYVYCNNGKILALDQQLNVTRTLSEDELFFCYLYAGDYNFIAKDKTTLVLDSKGIKVAEIQASVNAFLIGNTLYDKQNNSFLTIDPVSYTHLDVYKRQISYTLWKRLYWTNSDCVVGFGNCFLSFRNKVCRVFNVSFYYSFFVWNSVHQVCKN